MKKSLLAGLTLGLASVALVTLTSTKAVGDGDASPKACVDCHKADKKLSVKLASWADATPAPIMAIATAAAPAGMKLKGKHPKMPTFGKNIPKNCLMCHAKGSKVGPPLFQMVHLIHETGANSLDCRSCHKLDGKTGQMNIPIADEM